jgi:4-hydroxy-3-polyprenylbenzoate decarboxylase/2,5-furandicarboxylate decarboxylase 1
MSFAGLREFLAELEAHGELARVEEPVDPRFGISAWIRKTSDVGGPALYFEQVIGSTMPVVGGVFATPSKAILALGVRDHGEAVKRIADALEHPVLPVNVNEAPCQEVVLTGDDVDLGRLPIPTYSEQDGGAYVTVGVGVCRTLDHGTQNAGVYRMQVFGPREIGLEVSPYSDAHHVMAAYEAAGRDMEFAVALGVDPAIFLGTQARVPYGVDEFGVAGGLRSEPVRLTRCCTVDLQVPATSEIVLEGRIRPGVRHAEGPFGEFTGYVGPAGVQPVVELTAITMRRDPIFQAGLTGIPITENHVLKGLPLEAELLVALRATYPDVTAVSVPAEGASEFLVVIAMRQRYAYEARNVILAAFASVAHPKIVVVVDDDVDIYDMAKVWWAIATRCQPADDLIVIDRAAGGQLDPSAPELFVSSLLGIDATRPFGEPFPEVVRIPGVDQLPDPRTLVTRRPQG